MPLHIIAVCDGSAFEQLLHISEEAVKCGGIGDVEMRCRGVVGIGKRAGHGGRHDRMSVGDVRRFLGLLEESSRYSGEMGRSRVEKSR